MRNGLKKLAAAIAFVGACTAHAMQPSEVFVFGDSLSDSGYMDGIVPTMGANLFTGSAIKQLKVEGIKPKHTTFTSPEYSDWTEGSDSESGKIWTEQLATLLTQSLGSDYSKTGISNNKDYDHDTNTEFMVILGAKAGNNYAAGGATSHGEGITMDMSQGDIELKYSPPSVETQVQTYLDQHDGTADPEALYIIWVGANDLLKLVMDADGNHMMDGLKDPETGEYQGIHSASELFQIGEVAATEATNSIADDIQQLKSKGAQNFILVTMPRLELTPMVEQLANDYEMPDGTYADNFDFKAGEIKQVMTVATDNFNTLFNSKIAAALSGTNFRVMPIDEEMATIYQNGGSYTTDNVSFQFDMEHFSDATCQQLVLGDQYQNINVPIMGGPTNVQELVKGLSVSSLSCEPEVGVDASGDPVKLDNPPKHRFFEDFVHPTSQVHSIIAHKLKETIINTM